MIQYVTLALSALSLAICVAIILKLKKGTTGTDVDHAEIVKGATDVLRDEIAREGRTGRETSALQINQLTSSVAGSLKVQQDGIEKSLKQLETQMANLTAGLSQSLDKIREENRRSLLDVRADNERQLEKIRQTVDEKLNSTLTERFNQSFKQVQERLDAITKGFGEMQTLTSGIGDLKKILTNVKTRGMWGEVSLENLLSQILTPEQYRKQMPVGKTVGGEKQVVDFAICLPGKSSDKVYLPIDSKFPIEDYQRLAEAKDSAEQDAARKALVARLKQEAQSIKQKYIVPPLTTDFAVMYLPTEGLFAEAVQSGVADELQTKLRVVVCGPTTVTALLNSLQMGFRTVAIEKRSSEIWTMFVKFKKDFSTFNELLLKTKTQLGTIQNTIEQATKRTEIIGKRLEKVETENADLLEGETEDRA